MKEEEREEEKLRASFEEIIIQLRKKELDFEGKLFMFDYDNQGGHGLENILDLAVV